MITTELEFHGKFYTVFQVRRLVCAEGVGCPDCRCTSCELSSRTSAQMRLQVLKAATLEDAVTNLQHSVGALEQNLEVSTALYRQKLHEVESKLEHIQHIPQRRFSPHRRVEDLY